MSKLLLVCSPILLLLLLAACTTHGFDVPFNVTVGYPFTWNTQSFTKVMFTFMTANSSGVAVYQDLSDSNEFDHYSVPTMLKDYSMYGVFQIDMQKVVIPSESSQFSFKHDFTFGILNVNPKDLCIVQMDLKNKKIKQVDFQYGSFYNEIILPLQPTVYTFGIMGWEHAISAQFGVPTLINYRASLKYELHKNLNQYLSAFVNRPLTFPAHEYVVQKVDNHVALPSNDMVEIVSFSFTPMFQPSYQGRLVVHDFELTFDRSLGFVNKDGHSVDIDSNSLQCLYKLKEKAEFTIVRGSSVVFPDWQLLACDSEMYSHNDFFPEYVTVVANRKTNNPQPSNSQHVNPKHSSIPPKSVSSQSSQSTRRMIHWMVACCMMITCFWMI
ncbi:hypothetical protein C9374_011666 [Naegleria lovaniensis]|uniref:Uncharacterized protein n=1 Tax=Naegleria lovaniensis TaxID=51637 RepID=A0AA88KFE5_NAELO|nr:uncharacterized protein C9374_011666 [Naegleria lovaniensis]KAG2374001.1 hypothetical protein C9374_011666 [Naegleria lovaniensis]